VRVILQPTSFSLFFRISFWRPIAYSA